MNRVIEDAGSLAWPAIRRSGRPSVRTAARSESEAEIIRDVLIVNPFSVGGTLPTRQRSD
jgi:hypothetical protein